MSASAMPVQIAVWDPLLSEEQAAEYCGNVSVKTLQRMQLARAPMPGRGRQRPRFGYRLSVLNDFLAKLADPKARGLIREEPSIAEAERMVRTQQLAVAARKRVSLAKRSGAAALEVAV